ncbi:MAG: ABC transporter permease [Spirillospora sp.]
MANSVLLRRPRPRRPRWGWAAALWRPALLLAAVLAVWKAVTALGLVESYLVPPPMDTWNRFADNAGYLWDASLVTTAETLAGFAAAVVLGLLAALLMAYAPALEKTVYPALVFAQVVPKIAVAPLFVVWLGFGFSPKVLMAAFIAFFPVVVAGFTGLKSIDPDLIELSATMNATRMQTFVRFRFPAALPFIMSGLKVAVTLAVTGAVVGEFVGADSGLGYVIVEATGNVDTAMLYAALILLSLIGVVLFALVDLAERLLMPWHSSRRQPGDTTAAS